MYILDKHAFKSISIKFSQSYYQTSKDSPHLAFGKPDHHPLSLAVGTGSRVNSPINRYASEKQSTQSVDCNHKNPHMRLNSLCFTDSLYTRFCFFDWIPISVFAKSRCDSTGQPKSREGLSTLIPESSLVLRRGGAALWHI